MRDKLSGVDPRNTGKRVQKTSENTTGFFYFSFNKELQRNPPGNATFLHTLFLEKDEKSSEKKYREMFSYQFVAHMLKIRQI